LKRRLIINDAIIISDIHLGSKVCEVHLLNNFLTNIHKQTHKLIINGDLFDNLDFRRLDKHHWETLNILRRVSKRIDVIWIRGNHDGEAKIISNLIGVDFVDEFFFDSGDKIISCLHGDKFDDFIYKYPNTSKLADYIYRLVQKVNRNVLPKLLKSSSKIYLRCVEHIQNKSIAYAIEKEVDIVCVGHTHKPTITFVKNITYINSGCWTEKQCTYIEIKDGEANLKYYIS